MKLRSDPTPDNPVPGFIGARFMDKVEVTGSCWNWTASRNPDGYGLVRMGGKTYRAHRIAYEVTHGPISDGALIDHTCSNPRCVNPAHLRAVTPKQNQEHRTGPNANSSTGFRGVYRHERDCTYEAWAMHNGRRVYGGRHATAQAAAAAAQDLRDGLFTHDDHREAS
jgi:hypothetical protein